MQKLIGQMEIGSCKFDIIKYPLINDSYKIEIRGMTADTRKDAMRATELMDLIFGPLTTGVIHDQSKIIYREDERKTKTWICGTHGRHVMME